MKSNKKANLKLSIVSVGTSRTQQLWMPPPHRVRVATGWNGRSQDLEIWFESSFQHFPVHHECFYFYYRGIQPQTTYYCFVYLHFLQYGIVCIFSNLLFLLNIIFLRYTYVHMCRFSSFLFMSIAYSM